MHKILWDFDIQMNHQIPTRKPNRGLTRKKRTCHLMDFDVPEDHRVKVKKVKRETNTRIFPENSKNVVDTLGRVHKNMQKRLGKREI